MISKFMFDKKALSFYSVIIGSFFLISGIGKVIDTAGFSQLITQYGFGYLKVLSPLIVVAEIWLGLSLILLINPRRDSLFSFLFLVVFTSSFTYAHFLHGVNDCGCFGTLQRPDTPPLFSFIRNFILIIISFVVWRKFPKEKPEPRRWKNILIISVMGVAIFVSGLTFKTSLIFRNKSKQHKYLNQNIKNTELSKFLKTSPDSTYLIFCFTYTCPHCWNSIENLRQFKKSNTVDSVLTLAIGTPVDKLFFEQNFHPDFFIKQMTDDSMTKITQAFPTTFYIEHDTVKVVIQSVLPSPVTFKKHYITSKNN